MASLKESIAHITKHGVARTNRFNVVIALPQQLQAILAGEKAEDDEGGFFQSIMNSEAVKVVKAYLGSGTEFVRGLDIMCETAEFPSKSFATSETKYNGDYINPAFDITYAPVSMSFIVSRDFLEKNIVDKWMNTVVDPVSYDVGYFNDYVSPSIEIQQLNEQDEVTHKVILKDAYPTEISSFALNNESTNEIHKMTVSFVYRTWQSEEVKQPSGVSSLAQTPLGPYTTPILSNPAVQKATDYLKDKNIDLEGAAVDVYNQVDAIVTGTTGQSTNKSASLLNGIKANLDLNDMISSDQKAQLIDLIDGTVSNLDGEE